MKKDITIGLIILFILSSIRLFAQDEMLKENRPLKSFSGLSVGSIAHVYLKKGTTENVDIEVSSKELKDRLIVEVINDVLTIKTKPNDKKNDSFNGNQKITVYVTYNTLKSVQAAGASRVSADHTINSSTFKVRASGAAKVSLAVKADEVEADASGAGDLNLNGVSPKFTVTTSGASHIRAYELVSDEVIAEASGASGINTTANKSIEARASGVSNINYKGDAKVLTRDVSKMAKLSKR